eukprot:7777182-Alexandrium_andersonii.AAC.1
MAGLASKAADRPACQHTFFRVVELEPSRLKSDRMDSRRLELARACIISQHNPLDISGNAIDDADAS